jgi:two-component system, chemotaxis family, chemotaxis protein CheY
MPLRADAVSVLVLDDHPFMQQVMRVILAGLGVPKVVPATDVDQALELIDARAFDLVIADYRLGAKSGAEFTRLVRGARDGSQRFMPIIACTADTMQRVINELRDAGADEILAKPVSPRTVCAKINAVVHARRRFVSAPNYFGPDRRRRAMPPVSGVDRRALEIA